jgi:hypothetical protein
MKIAIYLKKEDHFKNKVYINYILIKEYGKQVHVNENI